MNRMDSTIVIVLSTRSHGTHIPKMDGQKKRLWSDGTGGRGGDEMNDRDCDNCVHHSDGGCSVWECSFEQKDDTIRRLAAIGALCGECQANCIPCEYFPCGEIRAVQALPPAQQNLQQSCNNLATDCISRQAAIDAFEDTTFTKNEIRRRLSELPPAQPVHNTGKWVRGTCYGLGIYNWTCKCGHVIAAKVPDRFCGACGCDNAERRTDE